MKKQENIFSWLGKIVLIFLMLFSQFHVPLEVLAEEIDNTIPDTNDVTEEKVDELNNKENIDTVDTNNEEKSKTEEDIVNSNGEITNNTTVDNIDKDTSIKNEVTDNNIVDDTKEDTSKENEVDNTKNDSVNNEEGKYTVTINGEEVTDYTISDNKVLTIKQTYEGEDGTYKFLNDNEVVDLSHAIYGDYKFTYKVVSVDDEANVLGEVTLTIHYNGDNSELLNKYTDLSYNNGTYSIRGKDTKLTVKDVLDNFDNSIKSAFYIIYKSSSTGESWHYITVSVVDEENNYIGYNDEITSNSKIFFGLSYINSLYSIKIEGDYNDDGIVNGEDAKVIVDNILNNITKDDDTPFSIIDATNSVFNIGVWDNSPVPSDELETTISNKSEAYQGEEFDVKYYINGFDKDILTGIQGVVNYDRDILELVDIDIDNVYGGYNDDGMFAYLLDNYNKNGVILTLKFIGINTGDANISIDDIIASNGNKLNLDNDSVSSKITIVELPKGSDVEETNSTNNTTKTTENTPVTTNNNVVESVYIPRYVALSSDNYIKSLEIDGYKIDFDMYKYEYSINVKNNVTSLKLNVILNDPSAKYEIIGNKDFKVGENVVEIKVTAENGDIRTYTIKVNRAKKLKQEVKTENKGAAKPIIIVLIILVIIGLIYVIFKDDEEENGSKK